MDPTVDNILSLNPSLQPVAVALVNAARAAGIPLMIISGTRSDLQNASGRAGAVGSWHLDQSARTGQPGGLAFDVQVYGYTRDQLPYEWWQALGLWAEQNLQLHWGGRFLHAGEPDVNHFDARRWIST